MYKLNDKLERMLWDEDKSMGNLIKEAPEYFKEID